MCKFIGVEVLAANALIDAIEEEKGRSITFPKLEEYGIRVVQYLENKYKEQVVILYNAEHMGNRILDYSEFFKIVDGAIFVKEGVTTEQLRKEFRTPLSYGLLKAILSKEVREIALSA